MARTLLEDTQTVRSEPLCPTLFVADSSPTVKHPTAIVTLVDPEHTTLVATTLLKESDEVAKLMARVTLVRVRM